MMRSVFYIAALVCACVLAGCGHSFQNNEIDSDLRRHMAALNRQLVTALSNGDRKAFQGLASDSLLAQLRGRMLADFLGNVKGAFIPGTYQPKDDYFERRKGKREDIIINSGTGKGERDYIIRFLSPTRKCYVSVGMIDDSDRSIGMLTIWNKYEDDWKLNVLRLGIVRVCGRDAVDWYYRAQQQHTSVAVADAMLSAFVCRDLLHPFDSGFFYCRDRMMAEAVEGIKLDADRVFEFPLAVESVRTRPRIFNLTGNLLGGNFVPLIRYATNVPMNDSTALRREADSLNAHIGEVFTDLNHNNRRCEYVVYPTVPSSDSIDNEMPKRAFVLKSASWTY